MEKSFPWPRGVAADSLVGYTAQEWAGIWAAMQQAGGVIKITSNLRTVADFSNIGVFYSVANRLVVTTAVNRVNVDTGAALVCGHAFYNDTLIGAGGDITNPGAGLARYDRVVLRCNFSAADYVPGFASAALFTVPSYTARITIVHGADGGGVPALTQDQTLATYWDIPLYQYIITEGGGIGTITALTDQREWVDAETKKFFVTPVSVFNDTDVVECSVIEYGSVMPDAKVCTMYGTFTVPSDYIIGTNLTIDVLSPIKPAAAGNIVMDGDLNWSVCGLMYDANSDSVLGPVAVTSDLADYLLNCLLDKVIVPTPLDSVFLYYTRNAQDPLDTVDDSIYVRGWIVSYLGWR